MVVVESDSVGIPIDPTATRPVRGWSIHPAIAIHGTAMLSLRYPESLDAPPDAIAVFGSGGMQFPTIVDPAERVIRARVDRLGDFLLRVSNPGTSTIARPHFLDFEPNVPNPFNPTTRIRFTIEATQQVRIDIHDVAGRRVARLLEARTIAGTHDLRWDGRGSSGKLAASGTYLCTIATEHASATRKLVLLR
jgi:hypothetical protein